ncbi:MAG: radical SAM protein [Candidatus Methanoperedens sp.]|nr:radical SAM protein [Candidatus Methanoperedens sp.]
MLSNEYPVLAAGYALRKLEKPFVYDIDDDQLYELDDEAFEFLKKCNGSNPVSKLLKDSAGARESLEYMINEGIIRMGNEARGIKVMTSPVPSLRYILLNITNKCNLVCGHCYIGKSGAQEISLKTFEKAVSQFEDMGGLKLMISGGEPLVHSRFFSLMEILPSYELRVVLLSNGTLIDEKTTRKLANYVDEVQVSIDGIGSHDLIRGKGSYEKAMRGISNLKKYEIPVSIATMIHKYNAHEFEEMQQSFHGLDVLSWGVDVPCVTGKLEENREFILNMEDASLLLKYGFGAGAHESSGDYTCGSHMCAVSPDGNVSKCGFFDHEPVGDVNDLRSAWAELCKKYLWTLDKLDCKDCRLIHECRGGCRFRAKQYKGILGPDPVLCHANGIMDFL